MNTDKERNLHKEYWGFLGMKATSFIQKNKKPLRYTTIPLVLFSAVYFGFLKYYPEFSFHFGTFSINQEAISQESARPNSKILDRAIFDLTDEISSGKLTSQERVSYVSDITGLQTRTEHGVVEDKGVGGLTVLVRGTATNGGVGMVRCDFSENWKARLTLLKTGTEIKFKGIISNYDLSRGWIVLRSCELVD